MAHTKQEDKFLKIFDLYLFKVFHPKYKEALTGTQMQVFFYILNQKLTYVRSNPNEFLGNTIKIDKAFKAELLEKFNMKEKSYEAMITRLVQGGILFRISNGYFQVNPYCVAKGEQEDINRARKKGVFRSRTDNLPPDASPFKEKEKAPLPPAKIEVDGKAKPLPSLGIKGYNPFAGKEPTEDAS